MKNCECTRAMEIACGIAVFQSVVTKADFLGWEQWIAHIVQSSLI
jgi:hypothetical protein